jgi:hypothetical protein
VFARSDSAGGRAVMSRAELISPRSGWMRAGLGAGIAVGLLWFIAVLAHPAAARAEIPIVGPVVKEIGGIGHTILHPAEAVLEALVKVLQAIFGGVEAKLITGVINGLLAIPNFNTGHVASLEHTTFAIAVGMLSAVLTLSIFRYYLAGLSDSGSGGFEAIQGLVRVVAAVGFIIVWPGVFSEIVQLPKAFDGALLGSTSVQHNVALLFDAALVVGTGVFALNAGLGLIFVVLVGFISAIVFIALLWMKVLLSVMMMFLYVSMPLCVVLWPVQEFSWLAVAALRALFVALLVPCVWAILFSLSSAVNADILTFAPSHSIIDTVIIRPLAGITLMLLCITIPRFLMRTAMIGPHGQASGGWRVWRTLTFGMLATRGAAGVGRTVAAAATEGQPTAQRMIDALPAQMRPPSRPGQGGLAGRVIFGHSGFTQDANRDKSSSAAGAAVGAEASAKAKGPFVRGEMQLPGLAPASNDRERIDRAGDEMYDQAGAAPSSAQAVMQAMGQLPAQTQRAIAEFRANDPQKLRDLMAHNHHSPSLTSEQRDALWTIGSAQNDSAREGIANAISILNRQTAESANAGTGPPGGAAPVVGAKASGGVNDGGPGRGGVSSSNDDQGLGPELTPQPPAPRPGGSSGGTTGPAPFDNEPFLD